MQRSSSDEPTRRASRSAGCSGASAAPPYAFVSGWDEPTHPEQETNLETDALKEWYRYIDSLARPPRRLEGGDDAGGEREAIEGADEAIEGADKAGEARLIRFPPLWGEPWTPPRPAPEELNAAAAAIVEQLAPAPPAPSFVFWSPSVPEIPIPELDAFIPTLEPQESVPRPAQELIAALVPPEPPAGGDAHPGPGSPPSNAACSFSSLGACGGEAPCPPPPQVEAYPPVTTTALVRVETEEDRTPRRPAPDARPSRSGAHLPGIAQIREQWPRYAERLRRVPTTEVAQNSYKTPFKETREELIQRLLDPPLTLEETARLLGVCPTTVRRYTNRGWLKHYRTPGNQRRFRLSAVLAFLEEHDTSSLIQE